MLDRGFNQPSRQWTLKQLTHHLSIMHTDLDKAIELDSIWSGALLPPSLYRFQDSFTQAARFFEASRIHLVEKFRGGEAICYWNMRNKFLWIDDMVTEQRINVDLLHYSDTDSISWTIEVRCLATIDDELRVHMFVASVVNGVDVQLPIYTLTTQSTNQIDTGTEYDQLSGSEIQNEVNEIFAEELRTLIQRFHQKKIK